ncbi:hypothetical protein DDE83_006474 [Stemphylium lycopersici]|uniref:BTB domain-containing protein n=1 Tax=Stemphylium lycopersici TaxID=183478 RepID=A0A364MZ08_STELY|nr:hypothetical protein DDE83_006474 [Stemphylium lycopersici]
MDDLSFLDALSEDGQSTATLKAVLVGGEVCLISDRICPSIFLDRCPLLYHAFEYGFQSRLQASIEAPSVTAVISLLRYCYTGSYLPPNADYGPVLLLPHVEVYKLAENLDIPQLQLLAHGNFEMQVEFTCCIPTPPQDLLDAIQFVYLHYSSSEARRQHGLVGTLLNYCISKFIYHKLGEDEDFIRVAAAIPEFRQDLCRTNMERNFEDECALDIIRLCLNTLQVQPCIRPTLLASRDLPQEMVREDFVINSDESQNDVTSDVVSGLSSEALEESNLKNIVDSVTTTLAHRPRFQESATMDDIDTPSSDDDEGFTIVSRPRLHVTNPEEPIFGFQLISTPVVDILAATGTDYASDDEWIRL